MIQLNVTTLVELTGLLLRGMLERQLGDFAVASIAGYLPGLGSRSVNAQQGVCEVVQSGSQ